MRFGRLAHVPSPFSSGQALRKTKSVLLRMTTSATLSDCRVLISLRVCYAAVVVRRGRLGARPPHFWASGFRGSASGRLKVRCRSDFGAGLTDREARAPQPCLPAGNAESPLAGHPPHGLTLTAFQFRPHSREADFVCLGMQSYSRQLCMSRGKHYRLYP